MNIGSDYMTAQEVAKICGVCEESARRMMKAGLFGKPHQVGVGGQRRHLRIFTDKFWEVWHGKGGDTSLREIVQGRLPINN